MKYRLGILTVILVTTFWIVHHKVQGDTQSLLSDKLFPSPTPQVATSIPDSTDLLPPSRFVPQTFNNCGPAALSMVMSMFGRYISQQELAEKMRPFNNPFGGVDDKSIFPDEFVKYAKEYGMSSLHRPNGSIDLLKNFIANDIPIVVRTWLHPNEDIGHFRIVRGYDDKRRVIIQDDSYEGPNLEYSYETFLQMWKPFNYGYILVYPREKEATVRAILGQDINEQNAWNNAELRARGELEKNPSDGYALFNISTANYYLGNYKLAVDYYEKSQKYLPARMLWYQLEPILAYQKLKRYEIVFNLIDSILQNGNLAYSELYFIRGQILSEQGRTDDARLEFEKAIYYNKNFQRAKDALSLITQ
ncbi:MAG: hypothetical protein KatS3mg083_383 [Candidatus Dojkabacteria bacterium]|nr:MAG: hypothetical protein KatS3mg083_383 [Candidatus Dojkabacteria bacterium]